MVSPFFNVCVGKDLLHHFVLASCAISLSRDGLEALRICMLSPVRRIVTSLNLLLGLASFAGSSGEIILDGSCGSYRRNPGPLFDEVSSGYASPVSSNFDSRNACSGRINYTKRELLRLKKLKTFLFTKFIESNSLSYF